MSTDRILIYDVHTTVSEHDVKNELLASYQGIKSVKRLCYSDNNPRELIEVQFQTVDDAEIALREGFFNINNLRCRMKPIEPSWRTKNQRRTNFISIYRSDMSSSEQTMVSKILLCDVAVTIDVNDLQQNLSIVYPGIKYISRLCFDEHCQEPTLCVQIEFFSPDYTKSILQDGFVFTRHGSFQVKPMKTNMFL